MGKLEIRIAIIGIGNMGRAIAFGLLKQKMVSKKNLFLSNSSKDNKKVVRNSEIIILAVKPQQIKQVLLEIKDAVYKDQLIISIAAGVKIEVIKNILSKNQPVVRIMPNLCALVGKSISVWVRSKEVTKFQMRLVKTILECLGQEILIEKELDLNKVTAISGSGPAYVFYLVEILEQAAVNLGLSKEIARTIALQTVVGSAYFLEKANKSANLLRLDVTSKGGTTEAAFKEFAKLGLDKVFLRGIQAGFEKSKQLSLIT